MSHGMLVIASVCIGFMGQGFGSRGTTGMASVRSCWKVRQTVPLQPMEVQGGADIHLQPGKDSSPEPGDA